MSGPRRTTGETVPFEREELAKLTRQTEQSVPLVKPAAAPGTAAPNANVVVGRRGNSAHSLIQPPPPPPPGEGVGDDEEVVIEMSGDDEDDAPASAPPRRSRSDTLSDPMTTHALAQAAREAPEPAKPAAPAATGPNRNVKRRG